MIRPKMMTIARRAAPFVLAGGLLAAGAAQAALPVGATAPDFTAQAALGGTAFTFTLADALKKGPVVLYFYPKAFTKGCTVEAHEFAEAAGQFKALGATLIGMSADDIDVLHKFSTQECASKFPVAADPDLKVIKAYDVSLNPLPVGPSLSNRTSFVIAPDGKILYVYSDLDPDKHVANTLDAVRKWRDAHPQG